MKEKLRLLLKLLLQMEADVRAVPEETIVDSLIVALAGKITRDDARRVIADAEIKHFISGTEDQTLGKVWMLSPSGKIAAQQLP